MKKYLFLLLLTTSICSGASYASGLAPDGLPYFPEPSPAIDGLPYFPEPIPEVSDPLPPPIPEVSDPLPPPIPEVSDPLPPVEGIVIDPINNGNTDQPGHSEGNYGEGGDGIADIVDDGPVMEDLPETVNVIYPTVDGAPAPADFSGAVNVAEGEVVSVSESGATLSNLIESAPTTFTSDTAIHGGSASSSKEEDGSIIRTRN